MEDALLVPTLQPGLVPKLEPRPAPQLVPPVVPLEVEHGAGRVPGVQPEVALPHPEVLGPGQEAAVIVLDMPDPVTLAHLVLAPGVAVELIV